MRTTGSVGYQSVQQHRRRGYPHHLRLLYLLAPIWIDELQQNHRKRDRSFYQNLLPSAEPVHVFLQSVLPNVTDLAVAHSLPKAQYLNFNGCRKLTDFGAAEIVQCCRELTQLYCIYHTLREYHCLYWFTYLRRMHCCSSICCKNNYECIHLIESPEDTI